MAPAPGPRSLAPILRSKTCAFIGAGTMGQALINGLLAQGMRGRSLSASDPRAAVRRRIGRLGVRTTARNDEAARGADVIILAVKPQQMSSVLKGLAPHITSRQLVVSIAAGVTCRAIASRLPGVPVVRVMPNLPATVGAGFAAYAAGRSATAAHRSITKAIFEAVGEAVELPERQFDAITAVSGSGPAYLFFLAKAWEDAGVAVGLSRSDARSAVRRTLAGSVRLLLDGRRSPQDWIARVASKRGTTEAALRVLSRHRVDRRFVDAVRAAARRSKALAQS